jgi:hypothetical protein
MLRSFLMTTVPMLTLAACGGSTTTNIVPAMMEAPAFGSANVSTDGAVPSILVQQHTGREVVADGSGYGFVTGVYPQALGAGGFAGLTEATNLMGAVAGSASFTGAYRVNRIDALALVDGAVDTSNRLSISEQITLTTNLSGTSLTGTQNDLTVNGTINGNVLGGTVSFEGLSGPLEGQINTSNAIGAFSGGDADTVYAGGFFLSNPD